MRISFYYRQVRVDSHSKPIILVTCSFLLYRNLPGKGLCVELSQASFAVEPPLRLRGLIEAPA